VEKRIILVTGATDGIGRQTALALAREGCRVLVHTRTRDRGLPVMEALERDSGNPLLTLVVGDLNSMAGVRQLAGEVRARTGHLDVLINNAGVFMKDRVLTRDGFETTFAVNYLASFVLTGLLMDHLEAAPAGRVVNVSSMAHEGGRLDFDNFQGERRYDPFGAYALSKLANVMFTLELAERLRGTSVTANCLHPGVVATRLLRDGFGMGGVPVERSTDGLLHLALAPAMTGRTGGYYVRCKPLIPAALALEAGVRERFWEHTEELVGTFRNPDAAAPRARCSDR